MRPHNNKKTKSAHKTAMHTAFFDDETRSSNANTHTHVDANKMQKFF